LVHIGSERTATPMIQIKRVYHEASPRDGLRILVDRLWPRGLKKEAAHVQEWRKDLAPSEALRRWFKHDPAKWSEFRRRYRKELGKDATMEELRRLAALGKRKRITLVYGAADEEHNQAVVLKELLDEFIRPAS
jgi:uncharacterized protein YeaO (DUF488 family)